MEKIERKSDKKANKIREKIQQMIQNREYQTRVIQCLNTTKETGKRSDTHKMVQFANFDFGNDTNIYKFNVIFDTDLTTPDKVVLHSYKLEALQLGKQIVDKYQSIIKRYRTGENF